jgi:cell division GTPase FtsZ
VAENGLQTAVMAIDTSADVRLSSFKQLSAAGAGKQRQIGRQFYEEHREGRDGILHFIKDRVKSEQTVLVVAGLGGGTGAGMIEPFLQDLIDMNVGYYVLLTTPYPRLDSELFRQRAYKELGELRKSVLMQSLGTFLVDNEFCANRYSISDPPWNNINTKIIETLSFVLTLYDEERYDYSHSTKKIDVQDLVTVIQQAKGRFIDIRMTDWAPEEFETLVQEMKPYKIPSAFSPNLTINGARGLVAVLLLPEPVPGAHEIFRPVDQAARSELVFKGIAISEEVERPTLVVLATGLALGRALTRAVDSTAKKLGRYKEMLTAQTEAENEALDKLAELDDTL